ncbi:MAG: pilus assembly protein [Rhodobacteraceae bacterium]|nr:pilus assembly protein [Paracoccaceae bacterium]
MKALLVSFKEDETATATVEFVMVFPIILWLVFSTLEAGWLMTQQTMLGRGLNIAVREVRIGAGGTPTYNTIKASICANAMILRDCTTALHLEMVELANPISSAGAVCINRAPGALAPVISWISGSRLTPEIMVLRACFVVDPLIPGAGLGAALPKDATGGYHMVQYSAFANEPAGI